MSATFSPAQIAFDLLYFPSLHPSSSSPSLRSILALTSHLPSLLSSSSSSLLLSSYSLSRSNQAIATLYTSIFPLFPSTSTDSRYHLQALRHLYVLATEPRILVTRDVETGQARSVEVCVRGGEQQEVMKRAPCIVPEWSSIKEVSVGSCDGHVTLCFVFRLRFVVPISGQ